MIQNEKSSEITSIGMRMYQETRGPAQKELKMVEFIQQLKRYSK